MRGALGQGCTAVPCSARVAVRSQRWARPLRLTPTEEPPTTLRRNQLRGWRPLDTQRPLQRRWGPEAAAALTEGLPLEQQPLAEASQVSAVVAAACSAMLLAALHRVAFSVLAVPIQQQFGLSLPQMGLLQSALLVGYVMGQIPLGLAADRVGGARLLTACLFLWSLACLLFCQTPAARDPFAYMLAARAALGLGQSCIMPAVASLSARWLPAAHRSRYTSTIYAFFSFGTVAGLATTPFLAQQVSWPATFMIFGLAGMASATLTIFTLPPEGSSHHQQPRPRQRQQPSHLQQSSHQLQQATAGGSSSIVQQRQQACSGQQQQQDKQEQHARGIWQLRPGVLAHLLMLCFTHSVMSWGFFILQSWIPTFIHSLGMHKLEAVGVLSALPWLATATVSVLAGSFSDWLQATRHLPALTMRRLMQNIALVGCALSLLPLALVPASRVPPGVAVALLTLAVAAQGCNYGGFHSYVQDVAPRDAGLVLGLTNTCGTLVGILGNVLVGHMASTSLGYQGVFALTVALNAAAVALWSAGARGEELELT